LITDYMSTLGSHAKPSKANNHLFLHSRKASVDRDYPDLKTERKLKLTLMSLKSCLQLHLYLELQSTGKERKQHFYFF
jgi:hypothetical protein